jgi:KaiA C-terminal domain
MVGEPITSTKHLFPMTTADEQAVLQQLKSDYRLILINYFTQDKTLSQKIDKFIEALFCANIPVPQIIEMHMELIDEFSKQLKLEGRSDETLLDYRLTLIDVLAHLCEVYRASVPK